MKRLLLAVAITAVSLATAQSQLVLSVVDQPVTIDFASFAAAGFTPTPSSTQLDSDAWAATGWNDGDLAFGETRTTGDYARGSTSNTVTTGGMYAFNAGGVDISLLIQPGTDDWAPGTLTLRIQNATGLTIEGLSIAYDLFVRNDQGRSNSFNFSHSADNLAYTPLASFDYTSPATADANGRVLAVSPSAHIGGLALSNGSFYYFRWVGDDVGGSGARDEFFLDNIVIVAVPEPSPTIGMLLGVISLLGLRRRR